LVRRNKLVFTAGAAVVGALVVGMVVSTWQAIRANRAERKQTRLLNLQAQLRADAQAQSLAARRAEQEQARQRQRAEKRLADTVKLLNTAFETVSPALADVIGGAVPREELAKAAAAIVDEVKLGEEMSPEFKRVLSQLYTELGLVHSWFTGNVTGDFPAGLKAGEEAIRLLSPGPNDKVDDDLGNRLARAEMMAGFAAWGMWRTNEAMAHFLQMRKWAAFLTNSVNPQTRDWGQRQFRWAGGCIGDTLIRSGELSRALECYLPLLRENRQLGITPQNAGTAQRGELWDLHGTLETVGRLKHKLGQSEEALPYLREALAYITTIDERHPDHAQFASTLAEIHAELGEVLLATGEVTEGLAQLDRAAKLADRLATKDGRNAGFVALKINVLRYRASGLIASVQRLALPDAELLCILTEAEAALERAEALAATLKYEAHRAALRHELDPVWTRLHQQRGPLLENDIRSSSQEEVTR